MSLLSKMKHANWFLSFLLSFFFFGRKSRGQNLGFSDALMCQFSYPDGSRKTPTETIQIKRHYAAREGKLRLGWQRNMWHSLCQQIVRQDPAYYAAYVYLRRDQAWRLLSFPYYTKNTYPGESTTFKHIDVNINGLLDTGRGNTFYKGHSSLINR